MNDYSKLTTSALKNLLKNTENQPKELCVEAIKRNYDSLEFIKEQTPEICMMAIK